MGSEMCIRDSHYTVLRLLYNNSTGGTDSSYSNSYSTVMIAQIDQIDDDLGHLHLACRTWQVLIARVRVAATMI